MDLSGSGVIYAFLIVPLLFAVVVIIQGIEKAVRNEAEGYVALGFGAAFIVLIAAAYILFIK